jgi:hypothetical protein
MGNRLWCCTSAQRDVLAEFEESGGIACCIQLPDPGLAHGGSRGRACCDCAAWWSTCRYKVGG